MSKEVTSQRKGKIANTILNVVLVAVIVFAIICSFSAYVSKVGSGVPSFLGVRPFAIQSESMEPFFNKGDLVIDFKVEDVSKLEVGDVITFWTIIEGQQVLNTHRITNITDYENYLYFDTKGDNNPVEDSVGVHQNDIVGKYVFHIPYMGTVLDFLQTGTGFFLVIVVPVFLFFVVQMVSFFKALMAYQAEKIRLQIKQEEKKAQEKNSEEEE